MRRFPFPDNLASNTSHTFPEVDHDILSSGFALLSARLWWTGTGLNLAVQDSAGRNVPIPDSLESVYLREWGVRASTVFLARSFGSFRAKSRGEVYQSILLLIATVALLVNTFVAAYSILR